MKPQEWVDHLDLQAHPEGGFFRETYRCKESLPAVKLPPRFDQAHSFSTAIYYLLEAPEFSAFHRIKQDELWHFYQGSGLNIHVLKTNGQYEVLPLGNNPIHGQSLQQLVTAGDWFAASVAEPNGYALVGCTVAPGFEFADFELADQDELIGLYPQHQTIIKQLTR
ncbi:cupin domain-containing protein [Marinicella litoralis]|uniref:DUF985 domain-containing protein n=1 Tax=Marinicella litoralis TaxID=644220 RepID=A0A4R6XTS9_9GAMM|nr:cupin domain-containing protein [Marinicella litoralis]TDR23372.1 hypothetical protein C8D91_0233 [Marinicella litoralis]